MFRIENEYNDLQNDLNEMFGALLETNLDEAEQVHYGLIFEHLKDAIDKAYRYDIIKYKQSQGGKKSSRHLTKRERKERATKASHSRPSISRRNLKTKK